MHMYSTTLPPYQLAFVALSTTQPPSSTQSQLVALFNGYGPAGLIRKGASAMRGRGQMPSLPGTPGRPFPSIPPSMSRSPDVFGALAATEFLSRLSATSGGSWSVNGGVPSSSVDLKFVNANGAPVTWNHTIAACADPAYRASVSNVSQTMTGAGVDADAINLEAPAPALAIALSLHMDAGAGTPTYPYAYTALLIDVIVAVVTPPTHTLKHSLAVPRPTDGVWGANKVPQASIPVPGYTAFPSGHATVCAALATVLSALFNDSAKAAQLAAYAQAIGLNRERAGLHAALDTSSGIDLGTDIGRWMVDAVSHKAAFPCWTELFEAASAEW